MKKISFVNMKGGVGKTTLAVNVADCLNQRHNKRVLIVDLDPQFNATQCLFSGEDYIKLRSQGGHTIVNIFDETPAPSLSAVSGPKIIEALELEDVKPWSIRDGFDIIPGDLELYRVEMPAGQGKELRLKRYLKLISKLDLYDVVIVDTPPTPSHYMMSALLASDYYLVPVKPDPLSRVGIDLLRAVIDRTSKNYGEDIECIGVVLTITDKRTKVLVAAKQILGEADLWKDKLYKATLPSRTRIAAAQGNQDLILEVGDNDSKSAISRITEELLSRIDDE